MYAIVKSAGIERAQASVWLGEINEEMNLAKITSVAKIPQELFAPKSRTLADLKPWERASFPVSSISVDYERNAYVSLNTKIAPPFEDGREYGEVWLDAAGKIHVDMNKTTMVWQPENLTLFIQSGHLKPIEDISWSPNTDAIISPR